ncbi:HAD family hydrolase [Tuberibacillus sp. Marseille-P3662]|uniref:HAD family hydrolase n=1 Tax=Tuberibacillus sp. Marseille-P3662 TaxID=1965358 RepID=UPI000A1CED51|nr:HAD hydrolase-like protein [Tuberibacillus sp. Marseille-P3662]
MYKTVLFDVDGVLLSEERYFDASALTIWEMLNSDHYLGLHPEAFTPAPGEPVIRQIREDIFAQDDVLNFIKSRGINANWDMVFLTFSYQLLHICAQLSERYQTDVVTALTGDIDRETLISIGELIEQSEIDIHTDYEMFVKDFETSTVEKQQLLLYLNDLAFEKLGVKTEAFSRNSSLWDVCREAFQEWYVGSENVVHSTGKPPIQQGKKGFLANEIPVVSQEAMTSVFTSISQHATLGIGTGRPKLETLEPLSDLDVLKFFDRNRIVTASDVLETEEAHPDLAPLAKPQPYTYVQALLGMDQGAHTALSQSLPLSEGDQVLVVGDSIADLMAARSMGARFAAVLTGLSGQKARTKFEELEADYIFDDMHGIQTLFE